MESKGLGRPNRVPLATALAALALTLGACGGDDPSPQAARAEVSGAAVAMPPTTLAPTTSPPTTVAVTTTAAPPPTTEAPPPPPPPPTTAAPPPPPAPPAPPAALTLVRAAENHLGGVDATLGDIGKEFASSDANPAG